MYNRWHIAEQRRSRAARATKVSRRLFEHLRSLRARFGVHDTDFSLSPPLLSHCCPPKASARWKESERRHWKRARTVQDRRRVDILSRSVFRTPDTPSFVCAMGVRDGRKRLRWARDPLRKILTQAGHKSFLRPRRTCQIAPFIILHLYEIIYDFTL